MPYHPRHVGQARWRVAAVALLAALFLTLYILSFRGGRERATDPPPATTPLPIPGPAPSPAPAPPD